MCVARHLYCPCWQDDTLLRKISYKYKNGKANAQNVGYATLLTSESKHCAIAEHDTGTWPALRRPSQALKLEEAARISLMISVFFGMVPWVKTRRALLGCRNVFGGLTHQSINRPRLFARDPPRQDQSFIKIEVFKKTGPELGQKTLNSVGEASALNFLPQPVEDTSRNSLL